MGARGRGVRGSWLTSRRDRVALHSSDELEEEGDVDPTGDVDPAEAWPRLLRSQGPSPVPAGGAARLWDVLGSLYMGYWAGCVFKCKRRQ